MLDVDKLFERSPSDMAFVISVLILMIVLQALVLLTTLAL